MRLPAGYTLLRRGAVRAALRDDLVPALGDWLLAPRLEPPPGARPVPAGRGGAYHLALPGAPAAIVRPYRRGGLLARFVRATYVGPFPRPLQELAATVEARRRGVSAPEVLGARVDGTLIYGGALVTAELPGAHTLLEALRRAPDDATRQSLAARAGRAVAHLHAAGVFHADLNLTNVVVHATSEDDAIALLDFDRARLHSGPLRTRARRRNLDRLARSLAKLDPEGTLGGQALRRAFCAAYAGPPASGAAPAMETACAS
jgi:3-deoxy-D-manno-octulosonic acid kinase